MGDELLASLDGQGSVVLERRQNAINDLVEVVGQRNAREGLDCDHGLAAAVDLELSGVHDDRYGGAGVWMGGVIGLGQFHLLGSSGFKGAKSKMVRLAERATGARNL